jgi:hypothetical protein
MSNFRDSFNRWKGFFLTDGLMYLVFVVMFIILFTFFR